MTIRKASLDDIKDIMNVENSAFIKGIREEEEVFIERIKRCSDLFLCFIDDNDKVIGYLSAEVMEKVPTTSQELELGHLPSTLNNIDKDNSYIYISSFALLPSMRGSGRGKEMWNKSISYLEKVSGIKHFLLLVNEEWQGASHIYKESGFKIINTFNNFFYSESKGKSSGILMEK